jgi:hypothetical protein
MEMPKLTSEHRRLHVLAGDWEGEENLAPSPWGPGGRATGRSTCRVDLDGFWIVQDYVEEKDGRVTFRGHGLFGYDIESQEYCWYWVDSMGFVPAGPSRGRWEGDTLQLHSKSPRGQGRYTYRFDGERSYTFRIENSFDGGQSFQLFMDGTYRKK